MKPTYYELREISPHDGKDTKKTKGSKSKCERWLNTFKKVKPNYQYYISPVYVIRLGKEDCED